MARLSTPDSQRFRGMPAELLPREGASPHGRLDIVTSGPRDLAARPFDFRNPFPLKSLEQARDVVLNGANTPVPALPERESESGSFDYYANDNVALGLPGGPECALVDLHGTLRAFTGGWLFGLGPDGGAPDLRVRVLERGHIPIVSAETVAHGWRCRFEYFAFEHPGLPSCVYPTAGNGSYAWVGAMRPRGRNPVLAVTCELRRDVPSASAPALQIGFLQRASLCAGAFYGHPRYAPPWRMVRLEPRQGGQHALCADADEAAFCLGTLELRGLEPRPGCAPWAHAPDALPGAPERAAAWSTELHRRQDEGDGVGFTWLIPLFPLAADDAAPLLAARLDERREATVRLWRERHGSHAAFEIPEPKVRDALLQAVNHLDITSVAVERTEYPTPGPSGGHHIYYDRDSVDMIYAYDLIGEHERAERMIDHGLLRAMSQETSAMSLWLLGKHFRLTRDLAWARRILPRVTQCVSWLMVTWMGSRETDGGLLPQSAVGDNELATGHYVSYHLYATAGLRDATVIADAAGDRSLAASWREFAASFRESVLAALERLVATTGGVITPTFEGFDADPVTVNVSWVDPPYSFRPSGAYGEKGGVDWHNLAAVFPTEVLPAHHPWVSSSLERWRHAYLEGTFPYPNNGDYGLVHVYNSLNLAGTWLRRGDWAESLRDLYGALLHTSATHASAEVADSRGRLDANCTPHNWFSGKIVRCIRDCLLHEGEDGRLHLLGCLSPAWMDPGAVVTVRDAPTELGRVSFEARMRDGGMELNIETRGGPPPAVVVHLPPFLDGPRATAGGAEAPVSGNSIVLRPGTKAVSVSWRPAAPPRLSYAAVVGAYLADLEHRRTSHGTR